MYSVLCFSLIWTIAFCIVFHDMDLHLQIHVCGIKETLNINQTYVQYNGVIWRVHLTLRHHGNYNETFMCCSKVNDLNYTAIDACLVLATPPCEFRKDIYKIEFPHVTGGAKMKYVPYLNEITSNIWPTEADVLLTVIASQRWRSVVVFYQNHSKVISNTIIDHLSNSGILVLTVNIDEIDDKQMADYLVRTFEETENMTVICNNDCIQRIASVINILDSINIDMGSYVQQKTKWVILSLESNYSPMLPAAWSNITNVVIIESNGSLEIYFNNTSTMLMPNNYSGVQITSEKNITSQIEMERLVKGRVISEIFKMYANSRRGITIRTLIFSTYGRELIDVNIIDTYHLVKYQGEELFPNVRYGFNKKQLIVTTLQWKPYTEKLGEGNYTGFTMKVLERLAHQINFTYEIIEPADGQWGVLDVNNSWTGMIGILKERKVDLIAAPLTVTYERGQVVDFLYPTFFDSNRLIISEPNADAIKWRTLIDIYSYPVLIVIAVSLIFVTFFLCFVEKVNPYYLSKKRNQQNRFSTLSDCFWYNYGALLNEGGTNTPDAHTGRTVLTYWWIFCFVSMAIYSGNLVAFLTVAKDKLPFKTMAGMVEQDRYKWGLYGGGAIEMFFSESSMAIHKKVWDGIVKFNRTDPSVMSTSDDTHYKKVINEDYVYFGVLGVAEYYKAKGYNLVALPEDIGTIPNAFAVSKNSPYVSILSEEIMRMHESGLIEFWIKESFPSSNSTTTKFKATTITLEDFQSAFYLLGIGVVLGFIVWIVEICLHRTKITRCNEL